MELSNSTNYTSASILNHFEDARSHQSQYRQTELLTGLNIPKSELEEETGQEYNNNYYYYCNRDMLYRDSYKSVLSRELKTDGHEIEEIRIEDDAEPTRIMQHSPAIIIYQNKNSYTGGTTALLILSEHLQSLDYQTLICNDTNRDFYICRNPPRKFISPIFLIKLLCGYWYNIETSIVVAGEWCHGALEDYGIRYFKGRAVQYHLGFHHMDDTCRYVFPLNSRKEGTNRKKMMHRGHVTVTHSHYYHKSLSHRILGAYYLACPMTNEIKATYLGLLDTNYKAHHAIIKVCNQI